MGISRRESDDDFSEIVTEFIKHKSLLQEPSELRRNNKASSLRTSLLLIYF